MLSQKVEVLSLISSDCSGESLFSKLKLIKDEHRSIMSQKRLYQLTMFSTEWNSMRRINPDNILYFDFSAAKIRKQFISVSQSSTDVQSDLTIHIITFLRYFCVIFWYIFVCCNYCLSSYVVCSCVCVRMPSTTTLYVLVWVFVCRRRQRCMFLCVCVRMPSTTTLYVLVCVFVCRRRQRCMFLCVCSYAVDDNDL